MKKLLLFILCIILYIVSGIALAYPLEVRVQNDMLDSSESGANVTLKNADIKLGATNSWISLGVIKPGYNTFTIDSDKNTTTGVLRVTLPNGLRAVSALSKDENLDTIYIHLYNSSNQNQAAEDIYKKYDGKYLVVSNDQKNVLGVLPLDMQNSENDSWDATCYAMVPAFFGQSGCIIYSSPRMAFIYSSSGFFGVGVSGGVFTSGFSPEQLVKEFGPVSATTYGFLFYIHVSFEYNPIGIIAYFNGGGALAGVTEGSGKFRFVDDSKTTVFKSSR